MATNHEALKKALEEHVLDSRGNIYTITTADVMVYVKELTDTESELAQKIDTLDPVSLAVEIADYIGGVGIVEHVELAIREALHERIRRETETGKEVCDG